MKIFSSEVDIILILKVRKKKPDSEKFKWLAQSQSWLVELVSKPKPDPQVYHFYHNGTAILFYLCSIQPHN